LHAFDTIASTTMLSHKPSSTTPCRAVVVGVVIATASTFIGVVVDGGRLVDAARVIE